MRLSLLGTLILLFGYTQVRSQHSLSGEWIIQTTKAFDHKTNYHTQFGLSEHVKISIAPLTKDRLISLLTIDAASSEIESIVRQIRSKKGIYSIQPNSEISLRNGGNPNDHLRNDQWYLDMIKAADAWNLSVGGTTSLGDTIVIAVIDNGFDLNHEDLSANIWTNYEEIPGDGLDNDNNGFADDVNGWDFTKSSTEHPKKNHGTSVLGLIGASGNNLKGIAGMNWNVKLMPVTIDNRLSSLIKAFDYVRHMRRLYNQSGGRQGAFIVASSYSGGKNFQFAQDHPVWCNMYDAMGEEGVLSVGATSNLNFDVDLYGDMPSTCTSDYLIVVTSTDEIDTKLVGAGYGAQSVDLGAPGVNLITTHIDNIYHHFSGTSAATPLVTGTIGLMYSIPNRNIAMMSRTTPAAAALEIKRYILEGVNPVSDLEEQTTSGGRLDLANAIRQLSKAQGSTRQGVQIVKSFPNPATDYFDVTVHLDDLQEIDWQVIDGLGRVIFRETSFPDEFPLNVRRVDSSNWPMGQYILQIRQGNFLKAHRFVIVR